MIMEALRWYVESLSAFWVSLAGGGLVKLILIGCLIYWICCRRGQWGCHGCHGKCSHCGCRCGHCPCGAGEKGSPDGDEGGNDEGAEGGGETA